MRRTGERCCWDIWVGAGAADAGGGAAAGMLRGGRGGGVLAVTGTSGLAEPPDWLSLLALSPLKGIQPQAARIMAQVTIWVARVNLEPRVWECA